MEEMDNLQKQKLEAEIEKIRAEKNKVLIEIENLHSPKKNRWDKMQVMSGLLIPLVIAYFAFVQNRSNDENRKNTASIQLKLDSLQNDRQMAISKINSRVGQVNLVSNFFDALLSTDQARKKLAIKAVLIALPEDGPDLVRIVSSSDDKDSIGSYAKASLDARRDLLINQMYAEEPSDRIKAFNDLYAGWKDDNETIKKLIEHAQQNPDNDNGVYNTLVFLNQMSNETLKPYVEDLNKINQQVDKRNVKIKGKLESILSRLRN